MSLSLRAVKIDWGEHSSLFIEPDQFPVLVEAIAGYSFAYTWKEPGPDCDVFEFYTAKGKKFLDAVKGCDPVKIMRKVSKTINKEAARQLVENMKSLVSSWKKQLDKDGQLYIWIDAY